MKLKVEFSRLEKALASIGGKKAILGTLKTTYDAIDPIEAALIERGEVSIENLAHLEKISFDYGLLAIGNTQITLHIAEPKENSGTLSQIPAEAPKFHISDCRTIESMKKRGGLIVILLLPAPMGYLL